MNASFKDGVLILYIPRKEAKAVLEKKTILIEGCFFADAETGKVYKAR